MKVVAAVAPPGVVEWRRRMGVDRHDEMWKGVLHMNPLPNRDHQELAAELWQWLHVHWARPGGNRVYFERNVARPGQWPNDYRGPDLVLLTPECFPRDKNEYIEGPPDVVVEIRSPSDETYEKLTFYAQLGVPEVWVVNRDTKVPDLLVLNRDAERYDSQPPGESGWLTSNVTGIELRSTADGKLSLRMPDDRSSYGEVPERLSP